MAIRKHVFVQGASRGLGLEFVQQLRDREDVERVWASCRDPRRAGSLLALQDEKVRVLALDVEDEKSVAACAASVRDETGKLHLVLNVAGLLHDEGRGIFPEKKLDDLRADCLAAAFAVNAIGPALVGRYFHRFLRHDDRSVFATISARVGSIEDNHLGGWYGYRASKAAQNMFVKTMAVEMARKAPQCVCVALHPGTVATDLSAPFRSSVPQDRLFDVGLAVRQLLSVIDGLTPDDTGGFFAWDGARIPY